MGYFFISPLLILLFSLADVLAKEENVLGGKDTKDAEIPWQVDLLVGFIPGSLGPRSSEYYMCGGALVTPMHVLTAANCVMRRIGRKMSEALPKNIELHVGSPLNRQGTSYQVSLVKSHEAYDDNSLKNDIALLTLAKRVELTNHVKLACLPRHPVRDYFGRSMTLSGWGLIGMPSQQLQVRRDVKILPKCDRGQDKFCAEVDPNKGRCMGDGGAPAIVFDSCPVLVGIASNGDWAGCDLYTDVYYFIKNKWLCQAGLNIACQM